MTVPERPRTLTPQEAQAWVADETRSAPDPQTGSRLVLTVAGEPCRTRASVVDALRNLAQWMEEQGWAEWPIVQSQSDAIENGADW